MRAKQETLWQKFSGKPGVIQNLARFSSVVHDKLLLQRYAHAKAAWVDNCYGYSR